MTPQTEMIKFLTENFDFQGYLSTSRTADTPERRSFKAKNNAYNFPKQLKDNFEKVQNTTF